MRWVHSGGTGVAAVLTLGVVLALAGCSTTPPPRVAPENLDSILLTASEINTVMGATGMQPYGDPAIRYFTDRNPELMLSNSHCLGAWLPAQDKVYRGSQYSAISEEQIAEPGNNPDHVVDQAAVSFPSADLALAFLKASAGEWKACAGQHITSTDTGPSPGQPTHWTMGNLVGEAPKITLLQTLDDGNGWACQHALNAVGNLVLDVMACGYHISDQARQIADKMAAKATPYHSSQTPSQPSNPSQIVLPFSGLYYPTGVTVDTAGNVYVTDGENGRVLKLPTGSTTQTELPFTGLKAPWDVDVDGAGNVYVTDPRNHRVLKLAAGSTAQTELPFTGLKFPNGVAMDAAGNIYVTDSDTNRVLKLAAGATSPIELPFTGLKYANGVAVDAAGNIYITDTDTNRVLKLAAGATSPIELPFTGLSGPTDVGVDTAGNVYVTSSHTNRVLKLAAGSKSQTELAFTGLSGPTGVAIDNAGNVYLSDGNNDRVLKLPAH
jgi:sugar lactone lactonase YvrE